MATSDPIVLTVSTGLVSGGQNQRDYNYVGTFPGATKLLGFDRFPGGAPVKQTVSFRTGVVAPWARAPVVFRV